MATEKNQDLGLGTRVADENRTRFLNQDGTFNVRRKGVFERGAFSPYHAILSMTWSRFYVFIISLYILVNSIFTVFYLLVGRSAFPAIASEGFFTRLGDLFFFSVQVITTIAWSSFEPATILAKVIISVEAMTGLLGFAAAAGLMIARFSNPATRIIFSERAVIAPYQGDTGFMVRLVNGRSNELIELNATVTVALRDKEGKRAFHQLALERDGVLVFPLSWTIVHPIIKSSPLYGMSGQDLVDAQAEFLVAIAATDEDLSRRVYARHSYIGKEIVSGSKFTNILERTGDGTIVVDPARVHEIEAAE